MFCEKCGTKLVDNICPRCVQFEQMSVNAYEDRFKKFFLSPNEKMVAVLGNSHLDNFLKNGSTENGSAVLSDKRVYIQGMQYYFNDKGHLMETYNFRAVDVRDITGTGFKGYADSGWIGHAVFWGIPMGLFFLITLISIFCLGMAAIMPILMVFLVLLSIFIYCIYQYFKSKMTIITIQYVGGEIGFDVQWFHAQEINMFQKQLRLAKDKVYEKGDNPTINIAQTQTSVADELSKLAGLLEKGLISPEEFEIMKKKLM